jgi:hypothetical protein
VEWAAWADTEERISKILYFFFFLFSFLKLFPKRPNILINIMYWGEEMLSDLGQRMLLITARRGYTGADREVFFHFIRGIRYKEMEKEVMSLEREGLISIEWVGPSNFTVSITAKGVEVANTIDEGVWHKSLEALEQMDGKKHHERSILEEEGEHSYFIKDKTKIEEVGALPSDIMQTLDDQIIAEREASNEVVVGVGVPAAREDEEGISYEGEEEVVERRIEGELEYSESEDGREIYIEVGDGANEDRIAASRATRVKRRVKERRISGEMDTPDFDDEEALAYEEEMDDNIPIEDNIHEYQPQSQSDGNYSMVSEKVSEDTLPEIEPEDEYEEQDESSYYEGEAEEEQSPKIDTYEDISNIDLYKQIVDAISLDKPRPSDEDTAALFASDDVFCAWEPERNCPLKSNENNEGPLTPTFEYCVVCQLVEIKHLLKKRIN